MTFEEFITRKKIDLIKFKTAEPSLFFEFQSHYSQMGEKSFDHSKKFLFNKLRRAYHLKEEPKPVVSKEVIEINEIASQAEPLLSPTIEATVYTPRFRTPGASTSSPPGSGPAESASTDETSEAKRHDKPGYKPRFRAPGSADKQEEPAGNTDIPPGEQSKPGFKPRFKAGLTSAANTKPAEDAKTQSASGEKPKPAYIPRFKPQVAPSAQQDGGTGTPDQENKSPQVYKPTFKAGIAPSSESGTPEDIDDLAPPSPSIPDTGSSNIPKEDEAKSGYKPRFKPSISKPRDKE